MTSISAGLRLAFPQACLLCAASATESGLCSACFDNLCLTDGHRCPTCAAPTPGPWSCGRCIKRPPAYNRVVVALDYLSPVDFLITGLKYGRNLAAARVLALPLARLLESEPYPDIVIPMPIAVSRLRERGFNQASEIARHVCRTFDVDLKERIAQRVSAQQSQTALPFRDRARNVRGAFRCDADLNGKTVAIVDDVITTGATLNELASVLKRAGAQEVIGWIAARTPLQSRNA
jgi:ComF family protein